MSDIAINYKGSSIATMDSSGTKTLQTSGKYCEGNIEVVYTKPATPFSLQTKSVTYTPSLSAVTDTVTADSGYDGLDEVSVVVNPIPSQYIVPSGTSSITSNGIYDITSFASVDISVSGVTPTGTYSVTSNGIYDITSYASVDVNVSGGGGGDHEAEDGIIQRNISGAYTNSTATEVGIYAFYSCSKLTTANFPNATTISSHAFQYCSELTTVSFPNVTSIGRSAFYDCPSLTTASFPNVTSIASNVFQGCSNLMSLYVLASSVASLGLSVFLSTPMSISTYTGSYGSIYVPASLVDSYKAATNWKSYSLRITSYVE